MDADVTRLLRAWSGGDSDALNALTPLVYEELHRRAHVLMRGEQPGHTLQTTALVNEAYLRLVDLRQVSWRDRAHFFALASRVIRHVLVDAARARRSLKRGADRGTCGAERDRILGPAHHALVAVSQLMFRGRIPENLLDQRPIAPAAARDHHSVRTDGDIVTI